MRISRENKRSLIDRFILKPPVSTEKNLESCNDNIQINKEKMEEIFIPLKNSRHRKVIDKWERITGKNVIFISFISNPPGTNFYSDRAKMLVKSLDVLGYDYIIVHFENDRNYYQNCCFKPAFINSKLKELNKDVVWIDGDTLLKRNMDQFINKLDEFDIGLVSYNGDMSGFVASPIFIRNTENSLELLEKWDNHCTLKVETGDCELDHDAIKHEILPMLRNKIRIKLNCDRNNSLHNGEILSNVNSQVPFKREILDQMVNVNKSRPCNYTNADYIIV